MMEEKFEYIPYAESVLLKQMGFDESCRGYWFKNPVDEKWEITYPEEPFDDWHVNSDVLAITYQHAFDWLRRVCKLSHVIVARSWEANVIKWSIWGEELTRHMLMLAIDKDKEDNPYDTYDEAQYAALKGLIDLFEKRKTWKNA